MHLVLLGVIKKLIQLWVKGPLKVRLSSEEIRKISKRLLNLRCSIPCEFGRKPRSLLTYAHWKATEFRTFLLYTGPVVLKKIMVNGVKKEMYENFLLLHTAISVLVSEINLSPENIQSCHELLVNFVQGFQNIYGEQFVSHNVHNLLHLIADVKKFGRLDKYSAFRFENYMSTIKRMIKKGHKPLEQIAKRYSEREAVLNDVNIKKTNLQRPHNTGPITKDVSDIKKQYKVFQTESVKINSLQLKNSCVLLKDGTFGQVLNIIDCINDTRLIVQRIMSTDALYEFPDSRLINIHKGILLKDTMFSTSTKNLLCKVWRVPTSEEVILLPLQHLIII
ncbi:uncharacterized protein LOC127279569 [Leptopilina boulardi]|uniref:uncharacterized protein LOC127279569 n=1 Tax=Leptopilina boulardi TaxID=63433 RepID=UPI0021F64EFA|nr:uncharacterized protein LOC127279569 [Leptopilina boulardi]